MRQETAKEIEWEEVEEKERTLGTDRDSREKEGEGHTLKNDHTGGREAEKGLRKWGEQETSFRSRKQNT